MCDTHTYIYEDTAVQILVFCAFLHPVCHNLFAGEVLSLGLGLRV